MSSDTLVFGAIYQAAAPFLEAYYNSLRKQIDREFDLFILNDGCTKGVHTRDLNATQVKVKNGMTPAQIRMQGIQYAMDRKYKKFIFTDSDDFYSADYVKSLSHGLEQCDYVYSKLVPVDQDGNLAKTKSPQAVCVISYNDILDKNTIGLGSSGVRLDRYIEKVKIPKDVIAIDWYLYTVLMLEGAEGKYVEDATAFYRQHEDNLVGTKKLLDNHRLEKGLKVKEIHYHYLCEYCRYNELLEPLEIYREKKREIHELTTALTDTNFRNIYMDVINSNMDEIYWGWWSEILSLREWEKYAD